MHVCERETERQREGWREKERERWRERDRERGGGRVRKRKRNILKLGSLAPRILGSVCICDFPSTGDCILCCP